MGNVGLAFIDKHVMNEWSESMYTLCRFLLLSRLRIVPILLILENKDFNCDREEGTGVWMIFQSYHFVLKWAFQSFLVLLGIVWVFHPKTVEPDGVTARNMGSRVSVSLLFNMKTEWTSMTGQRQVKGIFIPRVGFPVQEGVVRL